MLAVAKGSRGQSRAVEQGVKETGGSWRQVGSTSWLGVGGLLISDKALNYRRCCAVTTTCAPVTFRPVSSGLTVREGSFVPIELMVKVKRRKIRTCRSPTYL